MKNLNNIKTVEYIDNGIYKKDLTEYKKAVKEDKKNTVEKNPNKKYIFDPFVGYIEK